MDITNQFLILCTSKKAMTFDSPIPCFCILALLMDMEIAGIISLSENAAIVINSHTTPCTKSQQMLIDAMLTNKLKDIRGILNHFLRAFTFKELKQLTDSLICDIESIDNEISFNKGKLCIPDVLLNKYTITFGSHENNALMLSALLYGCRTLKLYMEKQSYRNFVAEIKHGINLDFLPLTTFIINNIDLIRGHIMGLVSN